MKANIINLLFFMHICIMPYQIIGIQTNAIHKTQHTLWDKNKKWLAISGTVLISVAAVLSGYIYKQSQSKKLIEQKKSLIDAELPPIENLRQSFEIEPKKETPIQQPPALLPTLPVEILGHHVLVESIKAVKTLPELQAAVKNFTSSSPELRQAAKNRREATDDLSMLDKVIDAKRIAIVNQLIEVITKYNDELRRIAQDTGKYFPDTISSRIHWLNYTATAKKFDLRYSEMYREITSALSIFTEEFPNIFDVMSDADIELFLKNGARINEVENQNHVPLLCLAIKNYKLDLAQKFVDLYGAAINLRVEDVHYSRTSYPPLFYALELIRNNLLQLTESKITYVAYTKRNTDAATFALKIIDNQDFNPALTIGEYKYTYLHEAMLTCNRELINALITHGININNNQNKYKTTPIKYLARYCWENIKNQKLVNTIVDCMIWFINSYNPDVTIKDYNDYNVLQYVQRSITPDIKSFDDKELNKKWSTLIKILKERTPLQPYEQGSFFAS